MKSRLVFGLLILFLGLSAQARVFSFANETVAPYVHFRGGMSSMGNEPYRWQSASTYSGDEVDLVYGGEFGLHLRTPYGIGVSFGVVIDTIDPVEGAMAANGAGVNLFTVDTKALSYGGSVLFDYEFTQTPTFLWKFVFGGGYQFADIENTYTLSGTGQPLVGGQTSFTETYKADIPFAVVGLGTEMALSGSATISFLFGYRHALVDEWTYAGGGQNFAGVHGDGADVVFEDASKKTINWSYPFLQVGFNFYIDTVR